MKKKFEVVFRVLFPSPGHNWSAVYNAESFAEAEEKALHTLAENDDRDSFILRIELY
jgi:hypothetical protein